MNFQLQGGMGEPVMTPNCSKVCCIVTSVINLSMSYRVSQVHLILFHLYYFKHFLKRHYITIGFLNWWLFPGGSNGKKSACSAGDLSSIPGSGRSGEGNGNPLQYSCLENPMDRGTTKSWTRLSDSHFRYLHLSL